MQVVQVQKYNAMQEIKYTERCREWHPDDGRFPQAAFFFFSTNYGAFRKTGYVAPEHNRAVWRPTKREAIQAFKT